jgi:putative oxygen-independent coproporphyrinogen III oxidase
MSPLHLYIHYPFCLSKCPYCDFNSHTKNNIEEERFLNGYLKEMDFFAKKIGKRCIKTIFFGGGTPSLMSLYFLEKIIAKISDLWQISADCEITLEANPTSFEVKKFQDFKKNSINRISLGIQSLNDSDLQFLGRNHTAKEAIEVIKTTSKIFDNFSFDLIYSRPDQNLIDWQKELQKALDFGTKHLSLYQLTIEKGTKFYKKHQDGDFIMPKDDLSAKFYEKTAEIMAKNAYIDYEISNYAKKDFESQHNLAYWRSREYLGIGAGAHSRINIDGFRTAIQMLSLPEKWLEKVENEGFGMQKQEKISQNEFLEEFLLMGLRLKDGIRNQDFINNFDKNIADLIDIFKLQPLIEQNLLLCDENYIKITDGGRLLTNSIIDKIIGNFS